MYLCHKKTLCLQQIIKTYIRGDFFLPQESLTLAEGEQYIPTAPYIPIGVRYCSTVRGQSGFSVEETYCRTAAKHLRMGQRYELTPCDALALTSKIPADFCIKKVKQRQKGYFSCVCSYVGGMWGSHVSRWVLCKTKTLIHAASVTAGGTPSYKSLWF